MNVFSLGGVPSDAYGIIMTAPPDEVSAERDVESLSIPGKNGHVIIDGGRYKNVNLSYNCALIPGGYNDYRMAAINLLSFLSPTATYCRLENTYDPEHFRMARVASAISVESIAEQAGLFDIQWDCKPQRFLKTGDYPIQFKAPGRLYNTTCFEALPLIKVYGSGAGAVTVGNITVNILAIDDQIILDCELQDAYRQVGDGAPESKNSSIYAPEFPTLRPGDNSVSWSGGVERIEIIPRWWTL